jgi:hypothetical protein
MKYLTQEKVLEHIPSVCKFKPTPLCLNSQVQNGNIRVKADGLNLLYCWEDAVSFFSKKENKVNSRAECKKSVCTRLEISEDTFEDDEEPVSEQELIDWANKNLK